MFETYVGRRTFFIISLISFIGIISISIIGYPALSPFVIPIAIFIVGLKTDNVKHAAIFGFLAAVFFAGLFFAIALVVLLILVVSIIGLFILIGVDATWVNPFLFNFLIAILLSPIIGVVAWFSRSVVLLFDKEEKFASPTLQSPQTFPTSTNRVFCPSCGASNNPASKFCVTCGSSLKVV